MDQYMSALGDYAGTPLGVAGADTVRGEARAGALSRRFGLAVPLAVR
jgi:hypothetical protein